MTDSHLARPRHSALFSVLAVLALPIGCGNRSHAPNVSDLPRARTLAGYERRFVLLLPRDEESPSLTTDRIGEVSESFEAVGLEGGLRYRRTERIAVRRDEALVEVVTTLTILLTDELVAERVHLARAVGESSFVAVASRGKDRKWHIELEDGSTRTLSAEIGVAELELFRRGAKTASPPPAQVLLPGYHFAVTSLLVTPRGPDATLTLGTEIGTVSAEVDYDPHGLPSEIRSSTGVMARAVDDARAAASYTAVDLIARASIRVDGDLGEGQPIQLRLRVDRAVQAPTVPGLRQQQHGTEWIVAAPLPPVPDSERFAGERELVSATREHLSPSLDAVATTATAALAHGRGDCTSHALLFASLAGDQGLEAKIVTGFRLDGHLLVRHRWVAIHRGDQWLHVDPTFDEVPLRGLSVGLAMSDAEADELALVDDVVFAPMSSARASFLTTDSAP